MHYRKPALFLLIALALNACTSSGYRDMNIVDSSETFNSIEISKNLNDRFRLQFESSINTTRGNGFSDESERESPEIIEKLVAVGDGSFAYFYSSNNDKISVGDLEYAASNISYNYSAAHKTISGSFDFFQRQDFDLRLALGISQYDYSVTATMQGDVDVYKHIHSAKPVTLTYETESHSITHYDSNYKIPYGKTTDKQLNFDFTDYGLYVAVEPRYQFNKHYGVSLRIATSLGKDSFIGTNLNSNLSLRFNYNPIAPLEIYLGYQHLSLGKDLDRDDTYNSRWHNESNINIDTRGLLTGIALRL